MTTPLPSTEILAQMVSIVDPAIRFESAAYRFKSEQPPVDPEPPDKLATAPPLNTIDVNESIDSIRLKSDEDDTISTRVQEPTGSEASIAPAEACELLDERVLQVEDALDAIAPECTASAEPEDAVAIHSEADVSVSMRENAGKNETAFESLESIPANAVSRVDSERPALPLFATEDEFVRETEQATATAHT